MTSAESQDGSLRGRLAAVLPKGYKFGIHHISTPPTKVDALYSAPPGERSERTYCENHFLSISIDVDDTLSSASTTENTPELAAQRKRVLVLGIEIFIYTTARSTTLFVSKADSTGLLDKLKLPKGAPSPIREVCATFIRYLVDKRRRKDVQCVVSLFARAQDQYLFPGSIEYTGKHVLDDRGLVRWWCRVLDPIVESPPVGSLPAWRNTKGYLLVPGLDTYETRAFIPRRAGAASCWSLSHPLERISHYSREFDWVPPRCLIPRFPDDPKSRFRDELDDEVTKTKAMRTTGSWKSVKTLDMFWEMMAFRQECSSGRMTGFIWVVFDDLDDESKPDGSDIVSVSSASVVTSALGATPETPRKQRVLSNTTPATTPRRLFPPKTDQNDRTPTKSKRDSEFEDKKTKKRKAAKTKRRLRGPIKSRQPRIKTKQRNYLLDRPVSTAYYYWPPQGRGERIVDEADYKRMHELLLRLDFATLDKAAGSTRRWLSEVGLGNRWGFDVTGTRELAAPTGVAKTDEGAAAPVNNLSGLVKRKRTDTVAEASQGEAGAVNLLSNGLVRKKPKQEPGDEKRGEDADTPPINVLSGGLVRKKEKI
ncbi:h3 k56 histone acetylation kat11 [Trichoderma arundinaceum]|uniref:histone acetyltransferase n=1 Tax=Trichoderma arundinaceum TaxID=490622 RepID=A0A395NUD5_TRIAR|nr:h3 k56 histone acetylation kat11 [Trichoderma arundinaceum]